MREGPEWEGLGFKVQGLGPERETISSRRLSTRAVPNLPPVVPTFRLQNPANISKLPETSSTGMASSLSPLSLLLPLV